MHRTLPLALIALVACSDVERPNPDNEGEVITTVVLTFTDGDGSATDFTWADPELDGDPVVDDIVLDVGASYVLDVAFLDELSVPAEDITEEVAAEADEHQVFLTGTAVEGPATGPNDSAIVTHAYDDADPNGDPIGLTNVITATDIGAGTLTVTLRHLPVQDGTPQKQADLAAEVAAGGFAAIGGETDAQVTFDLEVR